MRILLIALIFIVPFALAEEGKDFQIEVTTLDADLDASVVDIPGVEVHEGLGAKPVLHDVLPAPTERDAIFAQAGLTEEVKGWDDLERDLFFRKARSYNLSDVMKSYPKISREKVLAFKKVALAK